MPLFIEMIQRWNWATEALEVPRLYTRKYRHPSENVMASLYGAFFFYAYETDSRPEAPPRLR